MKSFKSIIALLGLLAAVSGLAQAQDLSSEEEQGPRLNKKNLVIKEWNAAAGGHAKVLDHQTIYNSDGKKIEEKEYTSSKVKWTKRFEYGANGKVSRELTYDDHNKLVTVKKIEWNEFGRKKVQYTYNAKGRLLTTKTFEYIAEDSE